MKRLLIAASLLALGGAAADSVATWDLTAEYRNDAGNPHGVWTYGWYSADFAQFSLCTPRQGGDGSPYWVGGIGGDFTPASGHNTGGGGVAYGVPLNWVTLHPGPSGQASVIRWTCPAWAGGAANISGQFLPGDSGVMTVAVRIDGEEAFHAADSGVFDIVRSVAPGTQIEFMAYGAYFYGNTPVRATVSMQGCTADIGTTGGVPGHDGVRDNNDFIVFIDYFFAHDPRADLGTTGGVPGADGEWDNNDFVVFIDQFFAGC